MRKSFIFIISDTCFASKLYNESLKTGAVLARVLRSVLARVLNDVLARVLRSVLARTYINIASKPDQKVVLE